MIDKSQPTRVAMRQHIHRLAFSFRRYDFLKQTSAMLPQAPTPIGILIGDGIGDRACFFHLLV